MFEKGKWYVNPNWMPKSIMKFSHSINTKLYFDEAFKNEICAKNDSWWVNVANKTRLATLEEIEKYLPDNYPDKIKVTQEEFKVGDWVVVTSWHWAEIETPQVCKIVGITQSYITAYVIRLNKDHNGNKSNWNFKLEEFRKAKLSEIPVKDLSNEEILEIAKQYYPVGTRYKNLNLIGEISQPDNSIEEFPLVESTDKFTISDTIARNGKPVILNLQKGWLYSNYKWAEIISPSNTEVIQEVKDDFVLPKKWFIIRNKDNYKIVNKWENDTYHGGNTYAACLNDTVYMFSNKPYESCKTKTKGYTEITTEQFKKYVLGEKVETNSVFSTELINKRIEELESSNEIYIPTITKQKKKIDYTINSSVFADIKINLPEKPKKIVKPILLKKFNLII